MRRRPSRRLVRGDAVHADRVEVVDGGGERDRLRDPLGAGLEALRGRQVLGLLHGDRRDHRAAGEERGQRVEQVAAAVEHADAGRREHLVTGEHGEVDVERAHVERQVRRRLAGVEHHERADGVGAGDEQLDRVHRAQHVRHVGERDDSGALADELVELVEAQRSVVVDRDEAQRRTGAGRELLPRDEVGVVLDLGHHDLVARAEPEALGRRSPAAERSRSRSRRR